MTGPSDPTDSSDPIASSESTDPDESIDSRNPTGSSEPQIVLIEDNPGDARLIEEMLRETDELATRIDPEGAAVESPTVHRENRLSDGLAYLESNAVDVVLLDLNLPDSTGLETVTTVVDSHDETPIVVLTGLRDEDTGIRAIQRGAQDYLVKDEVTSSLLARSIHHAIERKQQELERARQRAELERINRLNEISQDVTHLVITTSTREELERQVCERLVETDGYRFAWIGELQRGGQRIVPRASAGVEEGYLDEITVTADDSPTASGPAGRAIETKAVQTAQDVRTDPAFEPWRERAVERGYRSSASIPIIYNDLIYGVLTLYAPQPKAFSAVETRILGGLGDVIGHAIAAIERKDALASDSALELEFRIEGIAEELVALSTDGGELRFSHLRKVDDGQLAYGEASGIDREEFLATVEGADWVEHVRVLTKGREEYEFELRTTRKVALLETLADHGGRVTEVTMIDGELRLLAELPHGTDIRQLTEAIEAETSGVTFVAQRTSAKAESGIGNYYSILEEALTEKQRDALETAVYAGYFDWPRATTGEEIAERLGISPATFTQHLRTAERKFFDAVFDR